MMPIILLDQAQKGKHLTIPPGGALYLLSPTSINKGHKALPILSFA